MTYRLSGGMPPAINLSSNKCCKPIQRYFCWPTSGRHKCNGVSCEIMIECCPTSSPYCDSCELKYISCKCKSCAKNDEPVVKEIFKLHEKLASALKDVGMIMDENGNVTSGCQILWFGRSKNKKILK